MPWNRVSIHQVGKEACEISELGLFKPVDLFVLRHKKLRVLLLIKFKQLTETLPNVAVIRKVSPVLHAAFDYHVAQFDFLSWPDLHFQQLVTALFEVYSRHYHQIDCLA